MNAPVRSDAFALDAFLLQQDNKSLLRFVACGSVDHGKSTLIGRLLYGANGVFDDQLKTLREESRKYGTQGGEIDFSLLLDGLAAEREQKITIDAAYRFFSTERRKFIVADTPGHEQYTRNMATGASTADVALILVDAASGLRPQTRRHALIVSTVGVRKIVLVVNKMDKVGWSQSAFDTIEQDFRAFAASLDVDDIVCIPVAARDGDNVVERSARMDWYRGPTVLEHLETVPVERNVGSRAFRMPVQWVNRPDANFRGYSGMISGGQAYPGVAVTVLPSGQTSRVARIVTFDGDLAGATVGQSVTLTLEDDIDVSRGDVIASADHTPRVAEQFGARVVWMSAEPLVAGRSYILKLGTASTVATARGNIRVLDLDTGQSAPAAQLALNEIGDAVFDLDRPMAVDPYADNHDTGAFVLIDRASYDTLAMGIVQPERSSSGWARVKEYLRARMPSDRSGVVRGVTRRAESHARSIAKAISWRTTGSIDTFILTLIITGSGKWAGSIAATEIVTKIVAYYAHERVWSLVRWGRR
jgi:sulfate adenylyltransferase large subunit